MNYGYELADFGAVLNNLVNEVDRLGRALAVLERAAQASDVPDDVMVALTADARQLQTALQNTREHYGRLAALIELLEQRRVDQLSQQVAESTIVDARALLEDVATDMEELMATWRRLNERARFAVLRAEIDRASIRSTKWTEDWPVDGDLAQQLSRKVLEPRDQLLAAAYYDQELTQTDVARSLGVSQPTVATRLTLARGAISAAIALRRFVDRFPVTPETAEMAEFPRPDPSQYYTPVAVVKGEHRAILLLPSDRIQRRPPLSLERRSPVPRWGIGVYMVSEGDFRFRHPIGPLANLQRELPYPTDDAIRQAFPIEDDSWMN